MTSPPTLRTPHHTQEPKTESAATKHLDAQYLLAIDAPEPNQEANGTSADKKRSSPSPSEPRKRTNRDNSQRANPRRRKKKLYLKAQKYGGPLALLTLKLFRGLLLFLKLKLYYWKNHPIHGCVNLVLLTILFLLIDTGSNIYKELIHEPIPQQTIESVVEASRFTRAFSAEKAQERGTKEFLQAGAPHWMQYESARMVLYYARKANLSIEHQAVLLATAEIESGFNPMARAPTSSACGLFQFIKATGKRYGLTRDNCMDPRLNAQAGIEHYLDNFNNRIAKEVVHLTGAEKLLKVFELSYYLHHDGPQSDNHSDRLKAIILEGTPFLLRTYAILQQEERQRAKQPTFSQRFMEQAKAISLTLAQALQAFGGSPDAIHSPHTPEMTDSNS